MPNDLHTIWFSYLVPVIKSEWGIPSIGLFGMGLAFVVDRYGDRIWRSLQSHFYKHGHEASALTPANVELIPRQPDSPKEYVSPFDDPAHEHLFLIEKVLLNYIADHSVFDGLMTEFSNAIAAARNSVEPEDTSRHIRELQELTKQQPIDQAAVSEAVRKISDSIQRNSQQHQKSFEAVKQSMEKLTSHVFLLFETTIPTFIESSLGRKTRNKYMATIEKEAEGTVGLVRMQRLLAVGSTFIIGYASREIARKTTELKSGNPREVHQKP